MRNCKNPLLKLVIYFIIGVSFSIYFSLNRPIYSILFIASIFCLIIFEIKIISKFFSWRFLLILREFLLMISMMVAGIVISISHHDSYYPNYFGNFVNTNAGSKGITSYVEVDKAIKIKNKSIECKVSLKSLNISGNTFSVFGNAIVYLPKNQKSLKLLPGDQLELFSNWIPIDSPKNPGQFDYKNYLKFNEIEFITYPKNEQFQFIKSNLFNINRYGVKCRNACIEIFRNSKLSSQNLAISSALTFGYKDELDSSTKHAFSSTGAMHVLAVSGLHVGIVFLLLNFLIEIFPFFIRKHKFKFILILMLLWIYALITGLSPSVLRATTMLSFVIIGWFLNRSSSVYNSLAASAFFLLLINPFMIMQVGFQLSYLAVGGILFIQPLIENKLKPKNLLFKKLWTLTSVSIAAQCATFPLSILYFHQFPNYFLLSNIIVIPIAFIILILGLLLIITNSINWLNNLIGETLNFITEFLYRSVNYIDTLPYSLIEGISISILETFLYYLIIIAFFIFCLTKRWIYIYFSFIFLGYSLFVDYEENFNSSSINKLVVYDINDDIAIDLITGNNHYFISSEDFYSDHDQMLFNIKHNWYNHDLKPPSFCSIDSLKNIRMGFFDKSLIYLSEQPLNFDYTNDVVLVSGSKKISYEKIIKNNFSNRYVLMNDMTNGQKSLFKRICHQNDVFFYDLSKKGAFQMSW